MCQKPFGGPVVHAPPGGGSSGGEEDSESDDVDGSASDSHDSGSGSEDPDPGEGAATPHASEDEALEFVGPAVGAVEPEPLIEDFDDDAPLVAPEPVPLADPIVLMKPEWAPGVELAEVCTSAKTVCFICKVQIPRNEIRFKYWPFKSACNFLHPHCFTHLPIATRAHSIACLRYQQAYHAGPEFARVDEAISAALA